MANVTALQWQLGRALAAARERADPKITQTQAGNLIDCSQARIARIEAGELKIEQTALDHLLRAYGADEVTISELEQLRLEVERGDRGWWAGLDNVGIYMGLEQAARRIRAVESELIPGLLQTEAYAREQHEMHGAFTADEIDARVDARMRRRAKLTAQPSTVELAAVVSISALRWCAEPGDEIGAAQLRHLYEQAQLPNIDLRIMVYKRGRHPGMQGAFSILSFPGEVLPDVGWYEHALGGRVVDGVPVVGTLTRLFEKIRGSALGRDESRTLLADLARTIH